MDGAGPIVGLVAVGLLINLLLEGALSARLLRRRDQGPTDSLSAIET